MTQFSASHYSKTLQDSCPHLELPYLPLSPIALNTICILSRQIHISYCLLECLKGSSNLSSKQTLSLPTQRCFLLTFTLLSEEYHHLSIQLLTSKTYQAALIPFPHPLCAINPSEQVIWALRWKLNFLELIQRPSLAGFIGDLATRMSSWSNVKHMSLRTEDTTLEWQRTKGLTGHP